MKKYSIQRIALIIFLCLSISCVASCERNVASGVEEETLKETLVADTEIGYDVETDAYFDVETDAYTEGDTDAYTEGDTDAYTEGDTDAYTEGDTDAYTEGDTDAYTEGDTDAYTEGDTDADTEGDTDTDTEGDTDADTEGDTDADTEYGTDDTEGEGPDDETEGETTGEHSTGIETDPDEGEDTESESATASEDGHFYCEWTVSIPPLCAEEGEEYRECTECGHRETRVLPLLGHDIVYYEYTEPTCHEDGYYAYEACSRCSYTTFNGVIPKAHSVMGTGTVEVETDRYLIENSESYPFELSDDGIYSSTNKSDSTSSTLTLTALHPVHVYFEYRVSSEDRCDVLDIKHNGSDIDRISGEMWWCSNTVYLEAGDVLTFTYRKDVSVSSGEDAAYVKILTESFGITEAEGEIPVLITEEYIESLSLGCEDSLECALCGETVVAAQHHKVLEVDPEEYVDVYEIINNSSPSWEYNGHFYSTNNANYSSSSFTVLALRDFTLSVSYYVSSEDGDYLMIRHGEERLVKVSGTDTWWTDFSVELKAGETVTFTYSKDGSGSEGEDCAYVDIYSPQSEIIPAEDLYVDATDEYLANALPDCDKALACEVCGEVLIDRYGEHDLQYFDAREVSCTENGWNAYESCTRCNYTTYEEIVATGHKVSPDPDGDIIRYTVTNDTRYPFSTSSDGTLYSTNKLDSSSSAYTLTAEAAFTLEIQYSVSSESNYDWLTIKYNGSEIGSISGTSGTWNDLSLELEAGDTVTFTYSKDVSESRGSDCGYVRILTENTTLIDATEENLATLTVSCTEGMRCAVCGEKLVEAPGHDIKTVEAQEPTCENAGWAAYEYCSRCDYTTYEEIPALGHDIQAAEAQEPTCENAGWAAYEYCSRCDYTTYEEIHATGHKVETDHGEGVYKYTLTNDTRYPFSTSSDGTLYSTNKPNSSSSTYTLTAGIAFTLEIQYSVSSEGGWDHLIIRHNGLQIGSISGTSGTWYNLSRELEAGDTVTFTYSKDGSASSGSDCGYVRILTENTTLIDATEENLATLTVSCTEGMRCAVCGEYVIEPREHEFEDGECIHCGELESEVTAEAVGTVSSEICCFTETCGKRYALSRNAISKI